MSCTAPFEALRRIGLRWLGCLALVFATPAVACDVTTPTAAPVGTFSPSAIKASAPYVKTSGGFRCTGFTALTVLSGNFLKATIPAGTVLNLTSATAPANTVSYRVFADANATVELKAGTAAVYMNGPAVNLLNLLGDGTIDVPVYFKLASTGYVAPGTYTGSFSVRWDWNFCNGLASALGICVGTIDSGSKTGVINVTLVVAARPPTITIAFGPVTWDPVSGTSNPRAIPGSKRRISVSIANPDIVATELDALQALLPTPGGMVIALDGDGSGMGTVVQSSEGSPPSGVTFGYSGPSSTTDQVDFSSDNGNSWTYVPVAGSAASQAAVTRVRFRPQGTMAPASSYTITLPYSLK